jgi:hypothetical protein
MTRSATDQTRSPGPGRQRRRHRFPLCPVTGKLRLGERKDARLALKDCQRMRASAAADGMTSGRRECRAYRCQHCAGWHLTSQASRHGAAVRPQPKPPGVKCLADAVDLGGLRELEPVTDGSGTPRRDDPRVPVRSGRR